MKGGRNIFLAAIALAAVSGGVVAGCGSSGGGAPDGGGGSGGTSGAAGSSGGGAAGSCHANSTVGAFASWTEDGAPKCAYIINAQRATDATQDLLQLQATTLEGASVAFAVVAYGTPLTGTHACSPAPDGGPLIGTPGTVYVDFVHTGTKQSCSVTLDDPGTVGGAHARGSFSATFTGNGGAVVANGRFDTNVLAPPSK
jgi:hypothetical protein